MSFQVSPGVRVKEIDLTNVVPAVSSSIGAFCGAFSWGPMGVPTQITSENDLAEKFGTPNLTNNTSYFTAAAFLQYGNDLRVIRASTGAVNACVSGTPVKIGTDNTYLQSYSAGQGSVGSWAAKWPGTLGNSLKVEVCSSTGFASWAYATQFDAAPGTSSHATKLGVTGALDEVHIIVLDEDGHWTGTANTILERFEYLSMASDAKNDDGTTNYYKEVINAQSEYIWWMDHDTGLTDSGIALSAQATSKVFDGDGGTAIAASLTGGTDDDAYTAGEIQSGFDAVQDASTYDVSILISPPLSETLGGSSADCVAIANDLIAIAVARKDCVAVISPPTGFTTNPGAQSSVTLVGGGTAATTRPALVKAFADYLTSSSYGMLDSTSAKVYDKYNDVFIDIPSSGHVAGLLVNTDNVADAWFSPAGFNRGQLLGVTRINFNPKQAERDTLYKARTNPIVAFPGEGTVLFGDKTLLSRPSAFDRINVRRLFIVLEKAISTAAKFQLFEFNDEFTRAQFRNLVEPFLREVKGRRGITDFKVICDETNNTGQVVDANEFVADIFIKPARSINFITLNFVATRTGVDFSEIAG